MNSAKLTDHHLIPGSRGGKKGANIARKRLDHHMAWHHLFFNLCPWEIIDRIKAGMYKQTRLSSAQRFSWEMLFGEKSQEEVIRIIRKEWYPPAEVIRTTKIIPLPPTN